MVSVSHKPVYEVRHAQMHVEVGSETRVLGRTSVQDIPVGCHALEVIVVPSVLCNAFLQQAVIAAQGVHVAVSAAALILAALDIAPGNCHEAAVPYLYAVGKDVDILIIAFRTPCIHVAGPAVLGIPELYDMGCMHLIRAVARGIVVLLSPSCLDRVLDIGYRYILYAAFLELVLDTVHAGIVPGLHRVSCRHIDRYRPCSGIDRYHLPEEMRAFRKIVPVVADLMLLPEGIGHIGLDHDLVPRGKRTGPVDGNHSRRQQDILCQHCLGTLRGIP